MVGSSRRQAQLALDSRRGTVAQGRFDLDLLRPGPLLKDFSERYLEYSRANKRSHERDRYSLRHLNQILGTRRLTEITPRSIEQYKFNRRKEAAPATVNREVACLKHLFSMAAEWGVVTGENPVKKVKLFK